MYELRAKSSKETDIMMYGGISEWGKVRAEDFIRSLSDAKAKNYEKVNLKINSPGGSIFEGIAILAQMSGCELLIQGTVEGMAASMMSAVLQGCDKRRIVKGAMLMVHQGAGGVFGSANQIRDYADLLTSMNKTLADIYARRSKRKADYILDNWMKEGKDTWFTAEQALEEGLVDEIIEGKVKPLEKEQASLMEMAAHYAQFCKDSTESNKMDKEQLIKLLGLNANATEAEITAALTAMKAKAEKAPEGDSTAPKKDAAATEQPKKDAPAADLTPVIEGVVALAKERGMSAEQIEGLKKLAAVDVKAAMGMIPANAAAETKTVSINDLIAAVKGGEGSGKEDRKSWKYSDWQKKDATGLLALGKDKPEEFAKLFAAEHGYTPSVEEIKKLVA